MSESDLVLFERWRRERDAEAFAELVSRYADMVYATCRRVTGDAVAAEDVTQECFLKLAEGRAQVHRSVAGWLHSLATCRSLDRLRGEARRRRLEERFAAEAREPLAVDWEELRPHIDAAIEDLPERLREVVVRHFLYGETHAEVAARLGVSRPAVSKSIARGVERIRAFLRRRGIAVTAVALAGLVAEGAVEAAPESVRISLGKLALSGVPKGVPVAAAAGISLTAKVVAIVGGVTLVVTACVALFAWPAPVSPPPNSEAAAPIPVVLPATEPPPPTRVASSTQAADTPAPGATKGEAEEQTTATLRGVVRGDDALPLPGAKVEVSGIERFPGETRQVAVVTTKEDGSYEASGVETKGMSAVAVRASASGYIAKVEGIELAAGSVQEHMDFELNRGDTVVGQVLTEGGTPVPGALVMPFNILNTADTERLVDEIGDYAIACDEHGRFELGVFSEDHSGCEVEGIDIVAPSYGAGHFSNVTLTVGEVTPFRLKAAASVRGRIQWQDGLPAVGYVVWAQGWLPVPGENRQTSSLRACAVSADGTFEIRGLPPELSYDLCVRLSNGPMLPVTRIQTPPVKPGEVFEWNPVLAPLTRVTGRVHIQGNEKTPGRFSGRAIQEGLTYANVIDYNEDGGDFVLLFSKPGTYWVYAEYEPMDFSCNGTLKAFGKRVDLKSGDDIRVDLSVPKPYVFPVRVIDSEGQPIPNVALRICWNVTPDDKSNLTTTERALDAEGRFTWFCFPGPEVWFAAEAKGYHTEETQHRLAEPNVIAPEETLVLYPSAGLRANLVFSDEVESHSGVLLRVTYPDGTTEDLSKTIYFCGKSTEYTITSGLRAGRLSIMAVEVDVDEPHMSQTVECTVAPGEIYDLGDLVMR